MKKFNLLTLVLASLLFISLVSASASALWVDAYFENGSKIAVIEPGQEVKYYIDVIPNSFAKSFNVYVRLFDDKHVFIEEIAVLENYDVNSNQIYFSPLFTITQDDYVHSGDYFLDIKITQTATNNVVSIESTRIDFKVNGDRLLVADFVYEPSAPFVGDVVTFTSTSYAEGNDIVLEEWSIDGSNFAEGEIVTNVFNAPGTYQVTLRVTDDAGRTAQVTKPVIVKEKVVPNVPPVADFVYNPLNPLVGDWVVFSSTSYDPDGYIVNEEWFIDDVLVHQNSNESQMMYIFNNSGTYAVRLVVEDNRGATAQVTKNVVVTKEVVPNVPPVADFVYVPSAPFVGDNVNFTSTSYDSDGRIANEKWFIDNVLVHEGVNQTSFTHVFGEAGTYAVRLVVTDNDGATAQVTKNVVVKEKVVPNVPPVARFVYDPLAPYVGTPVQFTSTSYDLDGYIVNEKWFINNVSVHEGVNETSFTHTFATEGVYYIRLLVTDDDGATDSVTKSLLVKEKPAVNVPPVADFVYVPSEPFVGDDVVFTSTSYDSDGRIVNERWFINNVLVHEGVNKTSFTHMFREVGTYAVRLVVTDDDGATAQVTKNVVVKEKDILDFCVDADEIFDVDLWVVSEAHSKRITDSTTLNIAQAGNHSVYGVVQRGRSSQCQTGEAFFLEVKGLFGPIAADDLEPCAITTRFDYLGHFIFDEGSNKVIMHSTNDMSSANSVHMSKICIYHGEAPVENVPPVADFVYVPSAPFVGDSVKFTSTSNDPDGHIVNEKWFVNDVLVHEGVNKTSFTRTFSKADTYAVKLIVTDNDGAIAQVTKNVVVKEKPVANIPPVANFNYVPSSPRANDEVTFTSTSYDPDGHIVNEKWFIDNVLVHEGANITSFNHVFGSDGTYAVRLVVTDNSGATAQITKNVYVAKPIVNQLVAIIKGPQSPLVGKNVVYDGSSSYDTSGAKIVNYTWVVIRNDEIIEKRSSSSPYFDFVFQNKGPHRVGLIVHNEFGDFAEAQLHVYASRAYGFDDDIDYGNILTVDYHSVIGTSYGVVKTNDEFVVSITVTNRGDERLRNLRTTFALPEFGISEKSNSFTLDPGRTRTIDFHMLISDFDNVPLGYHEVLLGVAGDGITRYKQFPLTIN